MKKNLFKKTQIALMALCIAFGTVSLCACGGDDDGDTPSTNPIEKPGGTDDSQTPNGLTMDQVVGTWKIDHFKCVVKDKNGKVVQTEDEDWTNEKDYIILYPEGRYVYAEYSDNRGAWHEDGTGRFTIEGGKFSYLGGDAVSMTLDELSGDKMVVSHLQISDSGEYKEYITSTLRRVSKNTDILSLVSN